MDRGDSSKATEPINWSASEVAFNVQPKGRRNILIIGLVFVILDVFLFVVNWIGLLTLISSAALVVAMVVAVNYMSKVPTRQSSYQLDERGLTINDKLHQYSEFRAFGVRRRGSIWQLVLIPNQRFGVETVVYIDAEKGEAIVDTLAEHLPMEDIPESGVEKAINRLNF